MRSAFEVLVCSIFGAGLVSPSAIEQKQVLCIDHVSQELAEAAEIIGWSPLAFEGEGHSRLTFGSSSFVRDKEFTRSLLFFPELTRPFGIHLINGRKYWRE
jgi:hypothetical protein